MLYERTNNIAFSLVGGDSILEGLQHEFFPEFSIYSHDLQDHLAPIYRVRSSLLNDSDSIDITKSKIKTLCHLFRGAMFLLDRDYSVFEFKPSQIFIDEKCVDYVDVETPFNDNFVIPTYNKDVFDKIDRSSLVNLYLYISLRDFVFFKCLLFASDRFDYIDMYRIMECVKETKEKIILDPFITGIDKFTCSANNFTATGFASRHAQGSKDSGVQKRFISLSDSREMFQRIIANFAIERAKLIGVDVKGIELPSKIDWNKINIEDDF